MSEQPVEIELTLRVDRAAARHILNDQTIKSLMTGKVVRRRLVSTYFDTPDFKLSDDGMILRVRRIGRTRIQTLKARPAPGASMLTRMEEEAPVRSDRPDLSLVRDRAAAKRLARKRVATRLKPQFLTDFVRSSAGLRLPAGEVELAIDQGSIIAGKLSEPICEVEIELRAGSIAAVYELGQRIARITDATIEPRSKAERAYALRSGDRIDPVRARGIELEKGGSLGEALRRIGRSCAEQIRYNMLAVRNARSDEGIHQLRVGLRRARTMLSIFQPFVADGAGAPIGERLKALMAELSAAREWDVFRAEVVPDLTRALDEPGAVDAFVAVVEQERQAAHRRADAAVRGASATQAILEFEAWIEGGGAWTALGAAADRPAREAAREILQRLSKKVTRLLDGIAEAEDERVHDLRLRAKRLRYGAEFFASLFPGKKTKPYLQELAALQDHLGAFNDGVVGVGMMASLPVDRPARPELGRAIDAATGWCAAIAQRERADIPRALETFAEQKPFWR